MSAAAPIDTDAVSLQRHHEIEQFLFHEAELLDDRQIEAWIALFTDDLRYVMPIRSNRSDRDMHLEYGRDEDLAYFDESKASLLFRLRKLQSGQAWAESPPSRTRHLISNLRVQATDQPGEWQAKTNFVVYRTRLERQLEIFAGERIDVLRRADPGWRIAQRRILLDQGTLLAANLSFFF